MTETLEKIVTVLIGFVMKFCVFWYIIFYILLNKKLKKSKNNSKSLHFLTFFQYIPYKVCYNSTLKHNMTNFHFLGISSTLLATFKVVYLYSQGIFTTSHIRNKRYRFSNKSCATRKKKKISFHLYKRTHQMANKDISYIYYILIDTPLSLLVLSFAITVHPVLDLLLLIRTVTNLNITAVL